MKKIFSINISGINGYSFAIKCDASYDESSVLDLAIEHDLFGDEDDAYHAYVEEITDSEYDIKGLASATFEF